MKRLSWSVATGAMLGIVVPELSYQGNFGNMGVCGVFSVRYALCAGIAPCSGGKVSAVRDFQRGAGRLLGCAAAGGAQFPRRWRFIATGAVFSSIFCDAGSAGVPWLPVAGIFALEGHGGAGWLCRIARRSEGGVFREGARRLLAGRGEGGSAGASAVCSCEVRRLWDG